MLSELLYDERILDDWDDDIDHGTQDASSGINVTVIC